jgi:hypothetical protein
MRTRCTTRPGTTVTGAPSASTPCGGRTSETKSITNTSGVCHTLAKSAKLPGDRLRRQIDLELPGHLIAHVALLFAASRHRPAGHDR